MTGQRNPVPGLVIGANDPQDRVNQSIKLWALTVSPRMYQAFGPLVGTLPVPSGPNNCYLIQEGTASLTFASGLATFTFPQPFPNGVLSVLANVHATGDYTVTIATTTLSTVEFYVTSAGTAYGSTVTLSMRIVGF